MGKETKNMGVDGDVVDGLIKVNPSEVFVPDGRFRPLNEKKVSEMEDSFEKHGQLQPIIIDELGNLIAGNHRLNVCINLGIDCLAMVTKEKDPDKLALIEIDENLMRKELTQTELENHLAERKKLYNKLYPDTAKRGNKGKDNSGMKSFSEDTAESLGKSAKSVERLVKRGECASEELQEARDNKEITNADMDAIIKDKGDDKEAQHEALKAKIKAKAEEANKKVEEKDKEPEEKADTPSEVEPSMIEELEAKSGKIEELEAKVKELEIKLKKTEESRDRYKARIAKAKTANPDIKI